MVRMKTLSSKDISLQKYRVYLVKNMWYTSKRVGVLLPNDSKGFYNQKYIIERPLVSMLSCENP